MKEKIGWLKSFTLIELLVAKPAIAMILRQRERATARVIRTVFTLIELLVVIAIISILMTILLPALKNAKLRSKDLVCTNNLKQMGLVMFNYASSFDDVLAPCWYGPSNTTWCEYITESGVFDLSSYATTEEGYASTGACVCPLNIVRYYKRPVNYAYPWGAGGIKANGDLVATYSEPKKISRIPIPCSRAPILGDAERRSSTSYDHMAYYDFSLYTHLSRTVHSGLRTNILFVDGHVNFQKSEDLPYNICRWESL